MFPDTCFYWYFIFVLLFENRAQKFVANIKLHFAKFTIFHLVVITETLQFVHTTYGPVDIEFSLLL
jgi:hypothetical protein